LSKLVYLAGPISGLSFAGATEWRIEAIRKLAEHGIQGLNPLRFKDYLLHKTRLEDTYADLNILSSQKGITTRDRWDCQRSDIVLVNLLGAIEKSIGTCLEFGWADSARVPIVTVMEPGNVHDHAMIREVSGFIVPTLAEALDITKAFLA
jgi:nucleoside 2-deoxyribosyltransferase